MWALHSRWVSQIVITCGSSLDDRMPNAHSTPRSIFIWCAQGCCSWARGGKAWWRTASLKALETLKSLKPYTPNPKGIMAAGNCAHAEQAGGLQAAQQVPWQATTRGPRDDELGIPVWDLVCSPSAHTCWCVGLRHH